MAGTSSSGIAAMLAVPVLVFGTAFSLMLFGGQEALADCNPDPGSETGVSIDPETVPNTTIAGYNHDQLVNAAHIIQAGKDLQLGVRDQTIGVMTAMGESSLNILDRGDAAGPDSRGLFQQRDNGAWGSYEDRMDPYISSTNYFKALLKIEARDSFEPTIVANRVQRNADPYHYAQFWDAAVEVVEYLAGTDTGLREGNGNNVCAGGELVPGEVNLNGWAKPGAGPVNGGYGPRGVIETPAGPTPAFHFGIDLEAGGCEGPIWAAQAGTVSQVFQDLSGGWIVEVDHGGGVVTWYVHMYSSGILVEVGDKVEAGQMIARVGSSGMSTACHLHFEVHVSGDPVDPTSFLAEVGITY